MPEREALRTVADLMCLAARTAPKTRGVDVILVDVAGESQREALAGEMERIARDSGHAFFARDAANLRARPSASSWLRGKPAGLSPCGFCGFADFAANEAAGATCAFNHVDLGIAASSAAAVAALHHADCRMMYTVGTAARRLDLFGEPVVAALGIPLSGTGKNPYFDRKPPPAT